MNYCFLNIILKQLLYTCFDVIKQTFSKKIIFERHKNITNVLQNLIVGKKFGNYNVLLSNNKLFLMIRNN